MKVKMNPLRLLLLTTCLCPALPAQALVVLSEDDLSLVSGQDGLSMNLSKASGITVDSLSWQDDGKELQMRALQLLPLDADVTLDTGSTTGAIPKLGVGVTLRPFLYSMAGMGICNANAAASTCPKSFGEMALRTRANTTMAYTGTRGILDGSTDASATYALGLTDADFYIGQTFNSVRSLLILKDLNVSGSMTGKFSADAIQGLRFQGSLSLPRVNATTGGLQFDIYENPDIASGYTTTGAVHGVRMGLSGSLDNVDLRLVGDTASSLIDLTGASGYSNTSGIKLSATAELNKTNFESEIGEAGANAFTVRFSQFVNFLDGQAATPSTAKVNFGSMYINLIPAGGRLNDFRTNFGSIQQSVDGLGVAVRGLELMGYPKVSTLYDYANSTTVALNNSGTLMLPLYGLDSNLLLMPGGHPNVAPALQRGIGFNLKSAFTGYGTGADAGKTSALLLADTGNGKYIGIRNIDGRLLITQGQIFPLDMTNDGKAGLGISSGNNIQINLSGQFALDDLPDGTVAKRIKSTGHLFGLTVQLQSAGGSLAFAPAPSGSNYIAMTGSFDLQAGTNSGVGMCDGTHDGTCISITEPVDGSQIQLSSISGKLDLTDGRIDFGQEATASSGLGGSIQRGYISFINTMRLGDGTGATDIARIGNVNFIGGSTPTAYRLGEIVIPGGELYTRFDIKQR